MANQQGLAWVDRASVKAVKARDISLSEVTAVAGEARDATERRRTVCTTVILSAIDY